MQRNSADIMRKLADRKLENARGMKDGGAVFLFNIIVIVVMLIVACKTERGTRANDMAIGAEFAGLLNLVFVALPMALGSQCRLDIAERDEANLINRAAAVPHSPEQNLSHGEHDRDAVLDSSYAAIRGGP
jgi:hypothetical protein